MKKIIIGFAVAMVATISNASYLYWQVSDSGLKSGTFNGHEISGYRLIEIASANASYTHGGGASQYSSNVKTSYYVDTDVSVDSYQSASIVNQYVARDVGGGAYAQISGNDSNTQYTYYIEVMGYANHEVIGVSNAISYSDAVSAGNVIKASSLAELSSMSKAAGVSAWTGTSYAAPEPTSGLLLLVGGALLALRRRRA